MQAEGAGEATKLLQEIHLDMVSKFLTQRITRNPKSGEEFLATPSSPATDMVRKSIRSRRAGDFLTLVRFERGKKTYVYATVDDGGARFNPEAPKP